MCGIAGFIDYRRAGSHDSLRTTAACMAQTLRHRGPDDFGVWADLGSGVALGHTRLSILDLSPLGRQPMVSASGRHVITFNGEIYNFVELRSELEAENCKFRSRTDTEVILEAFAHWGLKNTLQRLDGMFALALWDKREKRLVLARDRFGEKPLYYAQTNSGFLFASELKALRAFPNFSSEIDREALTLFLRYGYIPSSFSIYRDVKKLPPASWITIDVGDQPFVNEPQCYWSVEDAAAKALSCTFSGSEQEAVEALELLLRNSVRTRMVSDVPVGAFLSGGIDSSTIAAFMQESSGKRVQTFAIGFPDEEFDESVSARRVANHLGTEHQELRVEAKDTLRILSQMPALYDEPFADSSQIPMFLVSQLARKTVTVALSGDGADELFAGYNAYRLAGRLERLRRNLPLTLRSAIGHGLNALTKFTLEREPGELALRSGACRQLSSRIPDKLRKLVPPLLASSPEQMYAAFLSLCGDLPCFVLGANPVAAPFETATKLSGSPHFINGMMLGDLLTYLPDDILVKVDRAAMAFGLETRIPMLDPKIVEFAWALPIDMKIRNRTSKWILRQVLYRHVPKELVDRPKSGFSIPLASWLRGPLRAWAEDLLNDDLMADYLETSIVRRIWREHLSGTRNWKQLLWAVLMFNAWLREQARPQSKAADLPEAVYCA